MGVLICSASQHRSQVVGLLDQFTVRGTLMVGGGGGVGGSRDRT